MDIMKQVPICLPEKLLSGIDARAKTMQLSRSAYIRLCIVKYEMILAKKEASAQPMISDDNNIISDDDLRERERKEKEAKRIESEREQILTATATKRACARDDDFFDLVHNFAVKKGYTVEEEEAWKAFAESNDWHFKKGDEITRENFRNSLVKFVQRRRDEAKKRQEREEAERRMNPDKPDKWGFTEFEYMFEATMNDLSIDEAKKRMRAKRRA